MEKAQRKSYSKEFKQHAVKMITEEGRKASEVSRDLGIASNILHVWKRKYLEDEEGSFSGTWQDEIPRCRNA